MLNADKTKTLINQSILITHYFSFLKRIYLLESLQWEERHRKQPSALPPARPGSRGHTSPSCRPQPSTAATETPSQGQWKALWHRLVTTLLPRCQQVCARTRMHISQTKDDWNQTHWCSSLHTLENCESPVPSLSVQITTPGAVWSPAVFSEEETVSKQT